MGVDETDFDFKLERQVQDIVVVGSLVTTSLERLITSDVPRFSIYGLGRDRLEMILRSPKTIDFMSQTPLEAAYGWLLSCRSAKIGGLTIGFKTWQIKCNDLQPYRLFNGHNS